MGLEDLTELERKTYEFIKEAGEIQPKNLPNPRMMGAVPNLKAKGLVEVFRKYTTWSRKRKRKFVRVKEPRE
ncbi:MAG: hypothetical protein ACE5OW_04150 [Candidatus Bathyarchaeia archaeon]